MRFFKVLLFSLFLAGFTFSELQAQESMVANGLTTSGSGGSIAYSIGQTFYSTNTGVNGSVNQGVQQPFEVSVIGVDEGSSIKLQCTVYPNPSSDYIVLKVENFGYAELAFQFSDLHGKLLLNQKVTAQESIIPVKILPSSAYFLVITCHNRVLKTFKIIKN